MLLLILISTLIRLIKMTLTSGPYSVQEYLNFHELAVAHEPFRSQSYIHRADTQRSFVCVCSSSWPKLCRRRRSTRVSKKPGTPTDALVYHCALYIYTSVARIHSQLSELWRLPRAIRNFLLVFQSQNMSRSNFSTSNHPDDPPPSYEDIICSSNATEDRNNPFEEQAKATHTRFINGRVPTIITTQGHTPTAPLCEAIGGGVSQYVIPENMNVSAGTILEVPISDSEYARAREYGRAPSPSPSTHRSTRIAPNVNNTFHSASDDWEEVDRSKLSNAEYRALLARRQRALEDEVRRLDQIEQNAQPAQRPHQTSDDYPYLKPLIVVAFIICSMIYIVCLLIRFAS